MVWHTRWLLFFSFLFSINAYSSTSAPKFSEKKIKIKNITLTVEVAKTPEQHAYGLMNRNDLPENRGMLFIFSSEEPRNFWMKDTFIDLSIGYFDKKCVLKEIHDMKATTLVQKTPPGEYPSKYPAQYALEVRQGWFKRNGIEVGDKFDCR